MLINCPRCGFSQPKDQYCASCGVNIETYVPRKTSLLKKIFSGTFSQVAVVVIAAMGLSYYGLKFQNSASPQTYRKKNVQRQSLTHSNLSSLQKSEISNPEQNLKTTQNETDISVELQNEEQSNTLVGSQNESLPPSSNSNLETQAISAKIPAITAAARSAAVSSVNIKVSYYEISRSILAYWIQNSRTSSDAESSFSSGVINRKLFADQIRYSSLKSEATKAVFNAKTNFKSDANKDGLMIGLESEVNMNSPTTGSLTVTKTTSQGVESIRASLNISPDSIYFLYWKNDLIGLQNEPVLSDIPPFQIFKSKQFMMGNGTTELVMIIESLN